MPRYPPSIMAKHTTHFFFFFFSPLCLLPNARLCLRDVNSVSNNLVLSRESDGTPEPRLYCSVPGYLFDSTQITQMLFVISSMIATTLSLLFCRCCCCCYCCCCCCCCCCCFGLFSPSFANCSAEPKRPVLSRWCPVLGQLLDGSLSTSPPLLFCCCCCCWSLATCSIVSPRSQLRL